MEKNPASPRKSPETIVRQQLESAIAYHKSRQEKRISTQIIERAMVALCVDIKFVSRLLAANPEPDIEAMSRDEIEAWMIAGLPTASNMPNELLEAYIARLLSQLVTDSLEIKSLSMDMEFMGMLARLAPGVSIFSLSPIGRAFVLYVTKIIGFDARDDDLIAAVLNYRQIATKLEPVIEYDGISLLLQDPNTNWTEFFTTIIEN